VAPNTAFKLGAKKFVVMHYAVVSNSWTFHSNTMYPYVIVVSLSFISKNFDARIVSLNFSC